MGPISDDLSSLVVAQLLFLQSESSKKPVHMYINSVTAGLGIYDTMQYILPPIATWCGQATDIQIQAEEIIKLKRQINGLYVKHTGLALDKIEMSMERDKFMSPLDAKEFGIIDKILDHPPKHGEKMENSEQMSNAANV
ncbi:ATP-dependent Clp protease proteolytic subunit [Blattella germanica]|nr:ATP-dependent Clp protease proteolytic subunit [Blattella germanica]